MHKSALVIYTPKMHLCGNALLWTIICIFIGNNLWTNSFSPSCFELLLDLEKILRIGFMLLSRLMKTISQIIIISISYSVSYLVPTFNVSCLFVAEDIPMYYSITACSRQGILAKLLSILFLTPRLALSSYQHWTLICLFWSGNLHLHCAHSAANPTTACQEYFDLVLLWAPGCIQQLKPLSPTPSHPLVPPE